MSQPYKTVSFAIHERNAYGKRALKGRSSFFCNFSIMFEGDLRKQPIYCTFFLFKELLCLQVTSRLKVSFIYWKKNTINFNITELTKVSSLVGKR